MTHANNKNQFLKRYNFMLLLFLGLCCVSSCNMHSKPEVSKVLFGSKLQLTFPANYSFTDDQKLLRTSPFSNDNLDSTYLLFDSANALYLYFYRNAKFETSAIAQDSLIHKKTESIYEANCPCKNFELIDTTVNSIHYQGTIYSVQDNLVNEFVAANQGYLFFVVDKKYWITINLFSTKVDFLKTRKHVLEILSCIHVM